MSADLLVKIMMFLAFVVAPLAASVWDGPSEIEASADVAADLADAQATAHAARLASAKATQAGYRP